ncbi:uncharacterized protein LOC142768898 [Rhipicephalus microplus]|uniref:uncharacterized protein LOC142768898 n=1 Tax=Rhipicephalus microplus TaxID=6941 RepID=UPI003F6A6F6B
MEILADCEQKVTSQAWVTFDSTADTLYCILVTEKRTCGVSEFESQPAVAELRTPIFELPDVSNLTADVRKEYITLTWNRPQGRFDYYSIEALDNDVSNKTIDKRKLDAPTAPSFTVTRRKLPADHLSPAPSCPAVCELT